MRTHAHTKTHIHYAYTHTHKLTHCDKMAGRYVGGRGQEVEGSHGNHLQEAVLKSRAKISGNNGRLLHCKLILPCDDPWVVGGAGRRGHGRVGAGHTSPPPLLLHRYHRDGGSLPYWGVGPCGEGEGPQGVEPCGEGVGPCGEGAGLQVEGP